MYLCLSLSLPFSGDGIQTCNVMMGIRNRISCLGLVLVFQVAITRVGVGRSQLSVCTCSVNIVEEE